MDILLRSGSDAQTLGWSDDKLVSILLLRNLGNAYPDNDGPKIALTVMEV